MLRCDVLFVQLLSIACSGQLCMCICGKGTFNVDTGESKHVQYTVAVCISVVSLERWSLHAL